MVDFLIVIENVDKDLNKVKFVYVGDVRNNMGNLLMIGCVKMGIYFVVLVFKEFWLNEELVKEMKEIVKKFKGDIMLIENIDDVKGVDVIYIDVWVFMGEEE